ncbi:hypothetical protein FQN54_009449 [Arachnomyces sp. PD_36]|nr:hypothetical protein FQN54_009449 [Arachnomyces sp. PD_36]
MKSNRAPFTFLSLPVEIRNMIYGYALVTEWYLLASFTPQAWHISSPFVQGNTSIAPCLLSTCKQIHLEAASFLYNGNTFEMNHPKNGFKWLLSIGHRNAHMVERLSLRALSGRFDRDDMGWYTLLNHLACHATGLRYLRINFEFEGAIGDGVGDDIRFVQLLARIKGLEEMVISGYYRREWPGYLEKKVKKLVEDKTEQHNIFFGYFQGKYLPVNPADNDEEVWSEIIGRHQ